MTNECLYRSEETVANLLAEQEEIRKILELIADETATDRRMEAFTHLRSFLIRHREMEDVCLLRPLSETSHYGAHLVAEAKKNHEEEIDLLETLFDFGTHMDQVLWHEMYADLQNLMESIMESKRQHLYPLVIWDSLSTKAAI